MKVQFDHQKLRKLREAKRLTQMKLAEIAETSDRYIRAMESGKRTNPSAVFLYKISLSLQQPVEAFMRIVSEESENENS